MISVQIYNKKLSVDQAYQSAVDPSCGAVSLFVGTTRNQNKGESVVHLDFETYRPMAIKEMEKIAASAQDKFDLQNVIIYHREGRVEITDIAVIITVSSPHRDNAFKACRFCIDELKKTVPIWKKETLEDGSYWVGSRP